MPALPLDHVLQVLRAGILAAATILAPAPLHAESVDESWAVSAAALVPKGFVAGAPGSALVLEPGDELQLKFQPS